MVARCFLLLLILLSSNHSCLSDLEFWVCLACGTKYCVPPACIILFTLLSKALPDGFSTVPKLLLRTMLLSSAPRKQSDIRDGSDLQHKAQGPRLQCFVLEEAILGLAHHVQVQQGLYGASPSSSGCTNLLFLPLNISRSTTGVSLPLTGPLLHHSLGAWGQPPGR